ncbi:MAG: transaldolase, partial [Microbacteriaceae bacterium]|nr:transaldolase [Microbacteriaceae bacterium]
TEKSAVVQRDNVTGSYDEARSVVERIQALGISLTDITAALEKEGVEKFIVSWKELLATVSTAMEQAA